MLLVDSQKAFDSVHRRTENICAIDLYIQKYQVTVVIRSLVNKLATCTCCNILDESKRSILSLRWPRMRVITEN